MSTTTFIITTLNTGGQPAGDADVGAAFLLHGAERFQDFFQNLVEVGFFDGQVDPPHARIVEQRIDERLQAQGQRCAARLSSEYWRVRKKKCKNPQGMVRSFLEYWDSRGGIGLYGTEISEAVEAFLTPPDGPKGSLLVVPECE